MKKELINIENESIHVRNYFKGEKYVSKQKLLNSIEDLLFEVSSLKDDIEDLEKDMEDNYEPIPYTEQIGVSDRDFI